MLNVYSAVSSCLSVYFTIMCYYSRLFTMTVIYEINDGLLHGFIMNMQQ